MANDTKAADFAPALAQALADQVRIAEAYDVYCSTSTNETANPALHETLMQMHEANYRAACDSVDALIAKIVSCPVTDIADTETNLTVLDNLLAREWTITGTGFHQRCAAKALANVKAGMAIVSQPAAQ